MERDFSQGIASATRRVYNTGIRKFTQLCNHLHISPLPSPEPLLRKFVSYLALNGISYNTIKVYLSAVRQFHVQQAHSPPDISQIPRLQQVLQGIKISGASSPAVNNRPERLSITPSILHAIKTLWELQPLTTDRIMLWAAFTTCFFGFMRSGELCSDSHNDDSARATADLGFDDVAVDSYQTPSLIHIHLKTSKTDPFYSGTDILIAATKDDLCPVGALLSWLVRRGQGPGPLFHFSSGALLTRPQFVSKLRQALSEAGISPEGFSGHSFRSGADTTAAQKGISDTHIKQLGRWKSQAYQRYIKTPCSYLATLASTMSTDAPTSGNQKQS